MLSGVTVIDPATTYVDAGVEIGRDAVLEPMTVLRGATRGRRRLAGRARRRRSSTPGSARA